MSTIPHKIPSLQINIACMQCQEEFVIRVNRQDLADWYNGKLIQDAFPYLNADQRELLISSTCGKCFDKMFAS